QPPSGLSVRRVVLASTQPVSRSEFPVSRFQYHSQDTRMSHDPVNVELGLDTFGDVTVGPDGQLRSPAAVIRDVVEQGVLADQLGIHFFGVGEHHRPDFAVSAPEVVLAAIAARTTRIQLGSAVTVLSSDDPVRVFERFSTLDAVRTDARS